jgi:hypothetical protein
MTTSRTIQDPSRRTEGASRSVYRGTVGVVIVALSVGCSEPISPTGPTSLSSAAPSITTSGTTARISTPGTLAAKPARHDVPFKGRLEGVVAVTFPDPLSLFVFIEAIGNATQLGRFTVEIPHLVDLTTGTGTGTYEFTAANGDKLTASFTGVGIETEIPGVVSIVENATITGGTGRFANAAGSFIALRSFDLRPT